MADTLPRVLIVDDSRMVRASFAKNLKDHFDIREEGDGEAGWQTLVLDHSIVAVISDLQMPKLDGYGLVQRLRSSKLRRLQELPFILVSGEEGEDERAKAKSLGVSDFVGKGTGSAEILSRLQNLITLNEVRNNLAEGREQMVQDPSTGLFTRKYVELQAAQALSHAARHEGEVSLMVLGFDNFSVVTDHLGEEAGGQVANRFAKLLAGKIRREDSLGHYGVGQYAIVSPGVSPALCVSFAERVREAVEIAHVAAQGQRLTLTVSIGVASVPNDRVTSAGALLELAGERMKEAMAAGGNRIVSGGQVQARPRPLSIQHALDLLRANRPEAVKPHLAALGTQLMPLLKAIDAEFGLDLPLGEIERRFLERTQA